MTAETTATERVHNGITSGVEFIGPAEARRILDRNDRNRNVRTATVGTYATDMAEGRWRLTGEAIKFAASGRLLDGRHRLLSVEIAEVTLPFLVVRGLPEEVMDVLDSGMRRTAADAMGLRGESNATTLASVAKMVAQGYMKMMSTSKTRKTMATM